MTNATHELMLIRTSDGWDVRLYVDEVQVLKVSHPTEGRARQDHDLILKVVRLQGTEPVLTEGEERG